MGQKCPLVGVLEGFSQGVGQAACHLRKDPLSIPSQFRKSSFPCAFRRHGDLLFQGQRRTYLSFRGCLGPSFKGFCLTKPIIKDILPFDKLKFN